MLKGCQIIINLRYTERVEYRFGILCRAKADAAAAALPVRQAVRRHLMAGRVADAEALLSQHAPGLVGPAGDNCIYFYLSCLKFIELVRCAPSGISGK